MIYLFCWLRPETHALITSTNHRMTINEWRAEREKLFVVFRFEFNTVEKRKFTNQQINTYDYIIIERRYLSLQ